jgi:phenylalanyl-tRNA synthetase alpha chain
LLQAGVFKAFDDMYPVVSCHANFDEILIPADHVSRSPNDTYYVSSDKVLRCHTSAHQAELLRTKQPAFLVTGGRYVAMIVVTDEISFATCAC